MFGAKRSEFDNILQSDIFTFSKGKKCSLRHFNVRDVTSCIDDLHTNSNLPWQHFAFIGDSRIRQQFFNLLKVFLAIIKLNTCQINEDNLTINFTFNKLIPDSDREIHPPEVGQDFVIPYTVDLTVFIQ